MHVKHRTAGRMEQEQLNNFACGQGPAKKSRKNINLKCLDMCSPKKAEAYKKIKERKVN